MTVIADWLDVTYSPESNPRDEIRLFLGNLGYSCQDYSSDREMWKHGEFDGILISQLKSGSFARLSASGGVLSHLREIGHFKNYLALLSDYPHRVTRLDAAHDVYKDAPRILADLESRYPREVSLNRQRLLRCHYLMSTRSDGLRSGTMYAGHRSKARVTARVYDKALEGFEKRGELHSPRTRYELTFRDGIADLWDALEPAPIFWAHSSSLLPVPADAPEWSPSDSGGWSYKRPEVLPAVRLARQVSDSSDLSMLIDLADRLGPEGRNTLMHAIANRLGVSHKGAYFSKAS